jgi:hypothetical protein
MNGLQEDADFRKLVATKPSQNPDDQKPEVHEK